jgi:predicted DNA-binding transcriptional regulator YafY
MPINKNAFIRYQTLDRCFRNPGRNYFFDDLLEECNAALSEFNPHSEGVKRRQLFDDIRFMESEQGWSIPLERHKLGRKTYYRYSDLKFSINNQPLNQMEAEQLRSAILVLSKFKGMPQFEWVNELIPKLEQTFSLTNSEHEIIGFDTNIYLKGIEYVSDLFNAILNKQVLRLVYQPFKTGKPITAVIHPYYLKQYNNRWFLFGLSDVYKNLSTYALDRIESLEVVEMEYIENDRIDFGEFFEDIVGVTIPHDGKLEKIVLKLSRELAPYVLTKPLHGSQKVKEKTAEGAVITIEVIPNYELITQILSMGVGAEVLEPETFRGQIKEIATTIYEKYNL